MVWRWRVDLATVNTYSFSTVRVAQLEDLSPIGFPVVDCVEDAVLERAVPLDKLLKPRDATTNAKVKRLCCEIAYTALRFQTRFDAGQESDRSNFIVDGFGGENDIVRVKQALRAKYVLGQCSPVASEESSSSKRRARCESHDVFFHNGCRQVPDDGSVVVLEVNLASAKSKGSDTGQALTATELDDSSVGRER